MVFDIDAEFDTLCERIGVDPGRCRSLRLRLLRLADDLRTAQAIAEVAGSRRDQLSRFTSLSRQLERMIASLELRNPAYQQVLTTLWSPLIARYLSSSTISRRVAEVEQSEVGYYGTRDFGDPGSLDDTEFKYVPPPGGFEALLETKRRAALGPKVTPYLVHLLSKLRQAIDDALAEEQTSRRSRGGNPGDRWRMYVLDNLLVIYSQITGKEPTGSPQGPFETLCRYTLAQLGFQDAGLAEAIQRVLYPRNLGQKT